MPGGRPVAVLSLQITTPASVPSRIFPTPWPWPFRDVRGFSHVPGSCPSQEFRAYCSLLQYPSLLTSFPFPHLSFQSSNIFSLRKLPQVFSPALLDATECLVFAFLALTIAVKCGYTPPPFLYKLLEAKDCFIYLQIPSTWRPIGTPEWSGEIFS